MFPVQTKSTENGTGQFSQLFSYDVQVNRVWTALLMIAAVAVGAGVVYVVGHKAKVEGAGTTPGYTYSPSTPVTDGVDGVATSTSESSSASAPLSTNASAPTSADSTSAGTKTTTVAFLGDDYTIGIGASSASNAFPALIGKALDVTEYSVGSDGAGYATSKSTDSGAKPGTTYGQEVGAVAALAPDVVVITGGRNDYLAQDDAKVGAAARSLFAALQSKLPKATIVVVSSFWGDSTHPSRLNTIDADVQAAAQASGVDYVSLPDPLHGHSSWMATDADPNDEGYRAIADALAPKLKPYLTAS